LELYIDEEVERIRKPDDHDKGKKPHIRENLGLKVFLKTGKRSIF
jgi:hypothetical protein